MSEISKSGIEPRGKAHWSGGLILLIGFISSLAASCAGAPNRPSGTGGSPSPASPSPQGSPAPERALASVPPEAREFAVELRAAVRRGDWGWAAARADPSFLSAMEGLPRDPYFYTYLFSAGMLSQEYAQEQGRFELLPVSKVRDIVWDEAHIEGPVAIVQGRFLLSKGDPFPFTLRLLWRLEPPRILGVRP